MNHAALILASGSPRRRELLSLTGLPYVVDAPEVDESCALPPEEAVQEISRRKGLAGAAAHPGCVVLSADTLVAVDGKALGKPHSEEERSRCCPCCPGGGIRCTQACAPWMRRAWFISGSWGRRCISAR